MRTNTTKALRGAAKPPSSRAGKAKATTPSAPLPTHAKWISAKKQKRLTRTPVGSSSNSARKMDIAFAVANENRRGQARLTKFGFSAPKAPPVSSKGYAAAAAEDAGEDASPPALDLDYADLLSPLRRLSSAKTKGGGKSKGGAAMATSPAVAVACAFGAGPSQSAGVLPSAWGSAAATGARAAVSASEEVEEVEEENSDTDIPGLFTCSQDFIDNQPSSISEENKALLARLTAQYGLDPSTCSGMMES